MSKLLLTSEVAEKLRVSIDYVRQLIRERKLKAYKEGRRGGYRIREQDVLEYMEEKLRDSLEEKAK